MRCFGTSRRATSWSRASPPSKRCSTTNGAPRCTRARSRLERGKFVLAVVGEFSSGKSFLLNALLGKFRYEDRSARRERVADLLTTDINPTTATITELEYGASDEATAVYDDGRTRAHCPLALRSTALSPSVQGRRRRHARRNARGTRRADARYGQNRLAVSAARLCGCRHARPGVGQPGASSRHAASFFHTDRRRGRLRDRHAAAVYRRRCRVSGHHTRTHRFDIHRPNEDRFVAAGAKRRKTVIGKHAYERIARLAAIHAHGTYVLRRCRLVNTPKAVLDGDTTTPSRREPLSTLSQDVGRVVGRPHRPRPVAPRGRTRGRSVVAHDRSSSDRRALISAMLALDDAGAARLAPCCASLPATASASRRAGSRWRNVETLLAAGFCAQRAARHRRRAAGRLCRRARTRALASARHRRRVAPIFATAQRLHILADRVVAHVTGDFAQAVANAVVDDLDARLEAARALVPLRWSAGEAAARAFGTQAGATLWSGDVRAAIASTIVFEAIGGPSIALVSDIAARFAARRSERRVHEARELGGRFAQRNLSAAARRNRVVRRRVRGSTATHLRRSRQSGRARRRRKTRRRSRQHRTRACRHTAAAICVGTRTRAARAQRGDRARSRCRPRTHRRFHGTRGGDRTGRPRTRGGARSSRRSLVRSERVRPRPAPRTLARRRPRRAPARKIEPHQRLRRHAPCLPTDVAGQRPLSDSRAFRRTRRRRSHWAARRRVASRCRSNAAAAKRRTRPFSSWYRGNCPNNSCWCTRPHSTPATPTRADVNLPSSRAHASEVLCLFSRQLSDRELELYERVAEFGRPMLFAHTIADNEAPNERRHVVELAAGNT